MGAQAIMLAQRLASGAWIDQINWPGGLLSSGWEGYTMRMVIGAAQMDAGTKLRFTFKAQSSAGNGVSINAAYTQIGASSGDPYDFAATPVPILFGGSASTTIAVGGSIVSDPVSLSIDGTRNQVVSVQFPATPSTDLVGGAQPNVNSYYILGANAATENVSGYTKSGGGGNGLLVTRVEVFQP